MRCIDCNKCKNQRGCLFNANTPKYKKETCEFYSENPICKKGMTERELCNMCTEYVKGTRCDNKDNCKLLGIVRENKALKNEVYELKTKMSYMVNPNAIGIKNDMGW